MNRQDSFYASEATEILPKIAEYLKYIAPLKQFPDEPQMYRYSAEFKDAKNFSDGRSYTGQAHGYSFKSKHLAVFKCLTESVERLCQITYKQKGFVQSSFDRLQKDVLDPAVYTKNRSSRKIVRNWVKSIKLSDYRECLLPAQLFYLNYDFYKEGEPLTQINSTGSAAGFDHQSTLLRAIYEALERDAFMCMYLTKIPPKRLDLASLNDAFIAEILQTARRFNFQLMVFDITSDLGIPTYLACLIDKTGFGPAVTLGTKTSLNTREAIQGTIEEAFHARPWLRREYIERSGKLPDIKPQAIKTLLHRGLYWYPTHMLEYLSFMLNAAPTHKIPKKGNLDSKKQLSILLKIFKDKKIEGYYCDITRDHFKKIGFFVYKAIIPYLQPLILVESQKTINTERLKNYAEFFGRKLGEINTIPQPFL